jgi:hypothetical protein
VNASPSFQPDCSGCGFSAGVRGKALSFIAQSCRGGSVYSGHKNIKKPFDLHVTLYLTVSADCGIMVMPTEKKDG